MCLNTWVLCLFFKTMQQTTKDIKLITLSLLLRTMPKHEQSLVMSHFSPEVVSRLNEIEQEAGADIEKIDWRPFTRYWGDLRKIIDECREEVRVQKLLEFANKQRPQIRDYMLLKLGKKKKGAPVILSPDITKAVDQFILNFEKNVN